MSRDIFAVPGNSKEEVWGQDLPLIPITHLGYDKDRDVVVETSGSIALGLRKDYVDERNRLAIEKTGKPVFLLDSEVDLSGMVRSDSGIGRVASKIIDLMKLR